MVYYHYHILVRQMCPYYLGLNHYGFSSNSAASLCSLFAVILTWCGPSAKQSLDIYKKAIAEELLYQRHAY